MALQLTLDCSDPHAQAQFWAVVLDYKVDDHDELIAGLVESGQMAADSEDITAVNGRRTFRDYSSITPVDSGDENRMLFQRVPEEKVVKNRLHVDVHTPEGEREAKVKTLIDLGARKLWNGQMGPMSWITLADPEGNEFCVS